MLMTVKENMAEKPHITLRVLLKLLQQGLLKLIYKQKDKVNK